MRAFYARQAAKANNRNVPNPPTRAARAQDLDDRVFMLTQTAASRTEGRVYLQLTGAEGFRIDEALHHERKAWKAANATQARYQQVMGLPPKVIGYE